MSKLLDAALENDVAAINRLVRAGADVHESDSQGWTALHYAASANAVRAAVTLLDHGAPIDALDRFGGTALGRAVFEQHVDMVNVLREHGADPLLGAAQLARMRGGPVKACFDDLPAELPKHEYKAAAITSSGTIPPGPPGERWQDAHTRLWKLLVPTSGPAPTLQGELVRCTGRLADEAFRNGNINWGPMHVAMIDLVERALCDGTLSNAEDIARVRAAAERIRGPGVELRKVSGPYYTLSELAVGYCTVRPTLIPLSSQLRPDPCDAQTSAR